MSVVLEHSGRQAVTISTGNDALESRRGCRSQQTPKLRWLKYHRSLFFVQETKVGVPSWWVYP